MSNNILSTVAPWDLVAEGYAETTMNAFRAYAQSAIDEVNLTPACSVLDVACGPGTVTLMIADRVKKICALDFSKEMIQQLNHRITLAGHSNIDVHCGDGQDLPYADNTFDSAFSLFGLMFFPDRQRAYAELYRALKPKGRAVVSSWAPVEQSPVMQLMFGAIRAIRPELPEPKTNLESLENPEFFKNELLAAGFKDVTVKAAQSDYPVANVDEFWRDMVKGSAPIMLMKSSMSNEQWLEKEQLALAYIAKQLTTLPQNLSAKAWIACGTK